MQTRRERRERGVARRLCAPPPRGTTGEADIPARGVPEDRPAPNFRLPVFTGTGWVRLDAFVGKILVVNVWTSWSRSCWQEAPVLESLWRRYAPLGIRFLGIDHMDPPNDGVVFRRWLGVTYPSAIDPHGALAAGYGVVGLPTTFVIDERGHLVHSFLGRVRGPDLAAVLDSLLGPARTP